MTWLYVLAALVLAEIALRTRRRRTRRRLRNAIARMEYVADPSALAGGPPSLECLECGKKDWELFHGKCRPCAEKNGTMVEAPSPHPFCNDRIGN